ncbi:MAG: cytochrome c, partial [Proteobacteria bacterium]|nr:cytochrome c [Pseudomonadota bacterium]
IVQGRANGMPGWGHMLPPEQIWKMTAYIEALGTDREPNPPPENPVYPNPPSEEAGNERLLEEDPAEEHEN